MDVTMKLRAACGHDSRSVDGCTNCEGADLIDCMRADASRAKNLVRRLSAEAWDSSSTPKDPEALDMARRFLGA